MEAKSKKPKAKRKAPAKKAKSRTPVQARKVFLYALALAALGGGAYLAYEKLKRKPDNQNLSQDDVEDSMVTDSSGSSSSNDNVFSSSISRLKRAGSKQNDNFPLKRGSKGSRVILLQQGLAKIIGSAAMNANGGIDGQFGSGTVNALKIAGYSAVVDEPTFNKITGSIVNSTLQLVFDPHTVAQSLYRAAQAKNLDAVITILKQIKSVSDYSAVNDYFKRQSFISKTIVTELLEYAFKGDEESRQQIKDEFQRIGLKEDDVSSKWSLQGLSFFKDIITLRDTVVTDLKNNKIPVHRNVILGDEIKVSNGMTWFRSIDNSLCQVPTQDVKYS